MSSHSANWKELIGRELLSAPPQDQNQPSITLIDSQSVLEVRGSDAEKFLQGQCTADMTKLAEGVSLAGGFCTVKGRVLSTFIATRKGEAILLRMTTELITPVLDYLKKFAAFYKVDLIQWGSPAVLSSSSIRSSSSSLDPSSLDSSLDSDLSTMDQFLEDNAIPLSYHLGTEQFREYLIEPDCLESVIEQLQQTETMLVSENSWLRRQINAGWLNLNASTTEHYLPHQLNLERLGAISFSKGCYTGQEIIARTEYRGKPKRRMHLVHVEFDRTSPNSSPKPSVEHPESFDFPIFDFPVDILDQDTERAIGSLICLSSTVGDVGVQSGLAILPVENEGIYKSCTIEGQGINVSVPEQPYPSMEK